jgi:hypothetical protein
MIISMKNSNVIEPATLRLLAQWLNKLRQSVPPKEIEKDT